MTDTSDIGSVRSPAVDMLSLAIITLTMATAGIHLYLIPGEFDKGATGYGTLFILTAIGYLLALMIAYAPILALDSLRLLGRAALIGIALAAMVAYVVLGLYDTLGGSTGRSKPLLSWWSSATSPLCEAEAGSAREVAVCHRSFHRWMRSAIRSR